MIAPPPPPKPPTPHKEMLSISNISGNKGRAVPVKEDRAEVGQKEVEEGDKEDVEDGEQHSEDKKHREKCNICQAKVRDS